ncbi:uncharacterized protein LOC123677674 isoform X2 [Harmonia axyridis]|nr:uncharacterized protein LOC123677674 isoform X2 [Harmonia axyridis]
MKKETMLNKLEKRNGSDDIIAQFSDDNIIPCTSKPKDIKKLKKQISHATKKSTKIGSLKPLNLNIKKNSDNKENKKTLPKIGLSRKQNKLKSDSKSNLVQLQTKILPQHNQRSGKPCSDKNKILQWLQDTRNKFERFSQTQSYETQSNTPQDVDMPSVSQIYVEKNKKNRSERVIENQVELNIDQRLRDKKAQSVENLAFKSKQLRRHSLECSSPIKMKQYNNLQEINHIENQLIINIMEDEVLDVIDKELSGENSKRKMLVTSNKKEPTKKLVIDVEDEFLDQLDNEMMEICDEKKAGSSKKTTLNTTEICNENKSKSSWKSIKKFKKTIGKTKVPKKLDISLQSTQKCNKKDLETTLNTSDPSKSTNPTVMENRTVDFQKMEEYFSKAIPKMIETNIGETSSQEILSASNEAQEKDNNSDIYIYQTQPLSTDEISPKIDKISYANELIKKLEKVLLQLTEEDNVETKELISLLPSVEGVFKIFDKFKEGSLISQKPVGEENQTSFVEKEIQTDLLSLDVLPLTPNAAFKTLVHEDAAIQTDKICSDCPHFCSIKNITDAHTSQRILRNDIEIVEEEEQEKSQSKKGALDPLDIELEQEYISPKLQTEKIKSQISSSKVEIIVDVNLDVNLPSFNNQTSPKANVANKINTCLLDSEIPVDQILEQCSTQYDVSSEKNVEEAMMKKSPNILELEGNVSRIKDNMDKSKLQSRPSMTLGSSQGSALMCSVPQSNSRVNRKLMFEKAMRERRELDQTLKRVRTRDSISDSDEERPYKMKCNRFIQNDFSIEFESESLNDNSLHSKNLDAEMDVLEEEVFPGPINKFTHSQNTRKENVKTNNSNQQPEPDTLLNYCDELIEKANRHISAENELPNHDADINVSQIISESNENIRNTGRFNRSLTKINLSEKSQAASEKMKTQDLLKHYDDLIDKANRQIDMENNVVIDKQPNIKYNYSQIPTTSKHMDVFEDVREKENLIKTQDLLDHCKHYDDLIDKANRQIDMENVVANEQPNRKRKHNDSQVPTTSKHMDIVEEVRQKENLIKTQDLLDHCNALIAKTTKEIARNEITTSTNEDLMNKIQLENDDEFFCQNFDQLDSVLEKVNHRVEDSKNKLSESLFESCKENNTYRTPVAENKSMVETENIFSTPRGRKSVGEDEKRKKAKNLTLEMKKVDGFNSSDDEIFSDVDVVETTPQKTVSFLERLSCSQAVNQNARASFKIQENSEGFPESMNIVPPPPGFDDIEEIAEKVDSEQIISSNDRESENVIPASLSPQNYEKRPIKKPLAAANTNNKHFVAPQEVMTTLSQQFMKVSPICKEKSKNLNVIEMVRQSKFSPLTILPKSSTPVLTSTPKQKSILSYVKPKLKSSQEASTPPQERPKPCIAFTRLSNAETSCVISLCNKGLATRKDKFGTDVTHMIVSVDKHNNVKDHTIKFISAIAAGKWVLNIKWVQECLTKNHIVDEEPFEVFDITGIPSPRISRLTRLTNPLLKGFKFFIPRSFSQTSAEDVKNIIQLLQGVIVSSIEELKDEKEYICIIICELVDTEDYTQYENWLQSYRIITVDINWLSLSVSRYKILSLRPHLLCSDDSIDELGYPSNLVVDVAPSLTQDATYN